MREEKIELLSQNEHIDKIIKVIRDGFEDKMEDLCVSIRKDSLNLFGLIPTVFFSELDIFSNTFDEYPDIEEQLNITVPFKRFRGKIDLAAKSSLKELRSIILVVDYPILYLKVKGTESSHEESLRDVPSVRKEVPKYIRDLDFATSPRININYPSNIRVVYENFKGLGEDDLNPIELRIAENRIEFSLESQTKPLSVLEGETRGGKSKTWITPYGLNIASKVADQAENLKVYAFDKGIIKFSYEFNFGKLEYIVFRAIQPEH